ncbi:MAG TPA: DUF481 domain-containing protein [Acidobacteriaceae bacterium]
MARGAWRGWRCAALLVGLGAWLMPAGRVAAQAAQAKPAAAPDVVVFTNGDRLSGKLLREVNGTVTFHSDLLGDINVTWEKIKELHSAAPFAVLEKGVTPRRKDGEGRIPIGALSVDAGQIELSAAGTQAQIPAIPVARAAYIIDRATLDKQLLRSPGLLEAWNGSATAGVTLVKATQSQYTVNSALALVRIVPTVNWLAPRHRTAFDFNSSFGKITQPGYTSGGVFTPAIETKSNILHGDGERDQYFSPRFYYLAEFSFDHNYAQALDLEQIYGAGVGWTSFKYPRHQLDLKAAAQYESQRFLNATAGTNQNLIGATLGATYLVTLHRGVTFTQQLNFIPAFNNLHSFSANETDALNFPMHRNFSFTVGSLDSYLNNIPMTEPPTQRNSFQFTVGATYAIKSKY